MAKLLIEQIENFEVITESTDSGKNYYLTGIFMESETKNRNGRIYPKAVMESAVDSYITEKVKTRRALGELGHPDTPKINEDRVSHLITDLYWDGNAVIGKAKILDTFHGKEVKAWIDGGVSVGMSSRALGSLKEVNGVNIVQEDFVISTVDVVTDPSCAKAYVEAVMENAEWVQDIDGNWRKYVQETVKKTSKANLEKTYFSLLEQYLNSFKVIK